MGTSGMGNDSMGIILPINIGDPGYEKLIQEGHEVLTEMNRQFDNFALLRNNREQVAQGFTDLNDALKKKLLEYDANLNELKNEGTEGQVFIIHESDKYYQEMEAGYEKSSRTGASGFHGRTIAILNYISIMSRLAQSFGYDQSSWDTMKFVALNLVPGAAGNFQAK